MCAQTKNLVSHPDLCLAEPLESNQAKYSFDKGGNRDATDAESSLVVKAAFFPPPAEQNCINHIMFSFSSLGRKVMERKWFEESIFSLYKTQPEAFLVRKCSRRNIQPLGRRQQAGRQLSAACVVDPLFATRAGRGYWVCVAEQAGTLTRVSGCHFPLV